MVHPGDDVPLPRTDRDHVDEGYSSPHQYQSQTLVTGSHLFLGRWRSEHGDHIQPSMPSPGEIRTMFGTSRICEYPEYQRPSSTVPDPEGWDTDTHLDDLEEKLLKIRQWSEATSIPHQPAHPTGFTEIGRRNASHRLIPNSSPETLFGADFGVPRGSRFYRSDCCSNRSFTGTVSESDESSQSGLNSNNYPLDDSIRSNPARKGSSIFTLNDDSRSLTSDEKEVMNIEGTSHSKAKSLHKLCDIVQSLRRVYEDNKKACHVVKKLLEVFNLNDEVNGKLEGDTKTILKEKFCQFLENSEPELDVYKDINKLFELLESGLTADEESTLQSTLESLCVKLNPELNCLQYKAQPTIGYCVSERELLTNEEDEVLIKLHNLSSDLSVTVLEEIDGKTSVVGQSLPKKNGSENRRKTVTNIPVQLHRGSIQKDVNKPQQITTSESNTSASSTKQSSTVLSRRNFGAFKDDLFKKAMAMGFTKDVEDLEKSAVSLSRRSQLALLEKKVNGRYKSMQIAEERRKLGAPERFNSSYKPGRTVTTPKSRVSSPNNSSLNVSSTILRPRTSNLETEEQVSAKKLGVNNGSNRRKIVLDILPVLRQDKSGSELMKDENKVTKSQITEISNRTVEDDNNESQKVQDDSLSEDSMKTASNEATAKNTEMDNECFVKKTCSKTNRRKTIHAIVSVTCSMSDVTQKYSCNGENAGDEVDKMESHVDQLPAISSKESFTIIRSSADLSQPMSSVEDDILSESILPDIVREPPECETKRLPIQNQKKENHYIGSLFFIFSTVALLYCVYIYGNFDISHDKFENYQKMVIEYVGVFTSNIQKYKEKCCEIFADSLSRN